MDTTNTAEMLLFKSVALRDSLGNDRSALSVWLSQCNTTFIEEDNVNQETVQIYPNPSNGNFQITVGPKDSGLLRSNMQLTKNCDLKIYNVYGQKMYSNSFVIHHSSFVISTDLPSGIYFYQVKDKQQVIGKGKIIVQ